jgi:hypothetical protein
MELQISSLLIHQQFRSTSTHKIAYAQNNQIAYNVPSSSQLLSNIVSYQTIRQKIRQLSRQNFIIKM